MVEVFCDKDDAHGGHKFHDDCDPGSPRVYCPGRTPAEVQYGRAPGDMHEPKPYTGEMDSNDDSYDHLHPYVD